MKAEGPKWPLEGLEDKPPGEAPRPFVTPQGVFSYLSHLV
jgi:hypothetical protein